MTSSLSGILWPFTMVFTDRQVLRKVRRFLNFEVPKTITWESINVCQMNRFLILYIFYRFVNLENHEGKELRVEDGHQAASWPKGG